jgi:hypothetical protein
MYPSYVYASYTIDDNIYGIPKGIAISCDGANGKSINFWLIDTDPTLYTNIEMTKVSYDGIATSDVPYIYLTKLDTINRIISGRFEFELQTSDGKKIRFTEGRFDIQLDVYNF